MGDIFQRTLLEMILPDCVSLPPVLDFADVISKQVCARRVFLTCLAVYVFGPGSTWGVVVVRIRAKSMALLLDGTSDIQVHGASSSFPFFLSLGCGAADLRGVF